MSSTESQSVVMSNNKMDKSKNKKAKKTDIQVYKGFKDSIQVRVNDAKELKLRDVFVQERKFGQHFSIQDFKQINKLLDLSNKVEQECRKILPNANYKRFSVIDNNNKLRIKISDFVEPQFINFSGFTSKNLDYKVDAICHMKISKYNNELFFSLVLAAASLNEKIAKESYKPEQINYDFTDADYDLLNDLTSDEEVVETLDGKHYENLNDEF